MFGTPQVYTIVSRQDADPQTWPDPKTHVLVHLDALGLSPELTADTRVRNLFLVHSFLDEQQLSREEAGLMCTDVFAKHVPPLQMEYAVSYRVVRGSHTMWCM